MPVRQVARGKALYQHKKQDGYGAAARRICNYYSCTYTLVVMFWDPYIVLRGTQCCTSGIQYLPDFCNKFFLISMCETFSSVHVNRSIPGKSICASTVRFFFGHHHVYMARTVFYVLPFYFCFFGSFWSRRWRDPCPF